MHTFKYWTFKHNDRMSHTYYRYSIWIGTFKKGRSPMFHTRFFSFMQRKKTQLLSLGTYMDSFPLRLSLFTSALFLSRSNLILSLWFYFSAVCVSEQQAIDCGGWRFAGVIHAPRSSQPKISSKLPVDSAKPLRCWHKG